MSNTWLSPYPTFIKPMLGKACDVTVGLVHRVKTYGKMIPPRSMIEGVGGGDFEAIGNALVRTSIELAGLKPHERLLDVGCGVGRMAVPLTQYLEGTGEYWGFDIRKDCVDWCQNRISSQFPNFHFQHVDLFNTNYNPGGKLKAQDFRFPYPDDYFDFVCLWSVFTHMLQKDVDNYLSEIRRVLRDEGRCVATFFLLNDESRRLLDQGEGTLPFKHGIEDCLTIDPDNPEVAIAYEEDHAMRLFAKHRLCVVEPLHYGSWCNRETLSGYQDVVVAKKQAVI